MHSGYKFRQVLKIINAIIPSVQVKRIHKDFCQCVCISLVYMYRCSVAERTMQRY